MNKKAQIAVFIIIGIIILAAVIFLTQYKQLTIPKGEVSAIDPAPVQNFVSACLEKTSHDAVVYIGGHGGFFNLPESSDKILQLPYYLKNNFTSWPSREKIESEIADYIDTELLFCLENFRNFKGMTIGYEYPISNVSVYDKKVIILTDFTIKIQQSENTVVIDKFDENIDSKLGIIINLVDNYVQVQKNDTKTICMSCLLDLVNANNLSITLGHVENSTFVFTITDKEMPIEEEKYEFKFLVQYNFSGE